MREDARTSKIPRQRYIKLSGIRGLFDSGGPRFIFVYYSSRELVYHLLIQLIHLIKVRFFKGGGRVRELRRYQTGAFINFRPGL